MNISTCAICELNNDQYNRKCIRCNSFLNWQCECGIINNGVRSICNNCGNIPMHLIRTGDNNPWDCTECNYFNLGHHSVCGNCGDVYYYSNILSPNVTLNNNMHIMHNIPNNNTNIIPNNMNIIPNNAFNMHNINNIYNIINNARNMQSDISDNIVTNIVFGSHSNITSGTLSESFNTIEQYIARLIQNRTFDLDNSPDKDPMIESEIRQIEDQSYNTDKIDNPCPICLECDGGLTIRLKCCNREYHTNCIIESGKYNRECPTCRLPLI